MLELSGFHERFCAIPYKDEGVYLAGGYDEYGDRKRLQYMNLKDGSLTTLDHMNENQCTPMNTNDDHTEPMSKQRASSIISEHEHQRQPMNTI